MESQETGVWNTFSIVGEPKREHTSFKFYKMYQITAEGQS